jgi:hypothetical protein
MSDPLSSVSRRDQFWDRYSSDADELDTNIDASHDDDVPIEEVPSMLPADIDTSNDEDVPIEKIPSMLPGTPVLGVDELATGAPKVAVLRPTPGELQHLNPQVAKFLQPVFDQLAETNGGHRVDVSTVSFVVKELGGPPGHTVRDVVEISPEELERPLRNQMYVVGHELTHVLQYDVIGAPGADADTRWNLMEARYAAEARGPGRGRQYDVPPDLTFRGLKVLDPRFTLESIAVRVGNESSGRIFD